MVDDAAGKDSSFLCVLGVNMGGSVLYRKCDFNRLGSDTACLVLVFFHPIQLEASLPAAFHPHVQWLKKTPPYLLSN